MKGKGTFFSRFLFGAVAMLLLAASLSGCSRIVPLHREAEEEGAAVSAVVTAPTGEMATRTAPATEESYAETYFVSRRGLGVSKSLTGKVILCVIAVSDRESSWDEASMEALKQTHEASLTLLSEDAKGYGVELLPEIRYFSCTLSAVMEKSSYTSSVNAALQKCGLVDFAAAEKSLKEESGAEEIAFLFCINREDRSFCKVTRRKDGQEFALLYGEDEDFRHELFHLFGARDLYLPAKVRESAESSFPHSIMLETGAGERVDDLTALAIGWTEEASPRVLEFFESVKDVKKADFENAAVENTISGKNVVQYSNGTYTGELKNGSPHGYGRMVWNSGNIYEGEWKNGKRDGYGVFTFASGNQKDGFWQENEFMGE